MRSLGKVVDDHLFVLHDNVREIPKKEFASAMWLYTFSYDRSPTLREIGDSAFAKSNLHDIRIPISVEAMGQRCFYKCQTLKSISFDHSSKVVSLPQEFASFASVRSIVIPSLVETIEDRAFFGCSIAMVEFELPSSLRRIESRAFSRTQLAYFTLPHSVEYLGASCFESCSRLKVFLIPEESNLVSIGQRCFRGCVIESVEIPVKVAIIGPSSLVGVGAPALSSDNPYFCFESPLVYSSDMSILFTCCEMVAEVVVPHFVTRISTGCFDDCSWVRMISFEAGSKLRVIDQHAFRKTSLSSIALPASLRRIGRGCFQSCSHLTQVVFPESAQVTTFGSECFHGSGILAFDFKTLHKVKTLGRQTFAQSQITKVIISRYIHSIGEECFADAKGLVEVVFQNGAVLAIIEQNAFCGSGIRAIEFPASLQRIGPGAFMNCMSLQMVDFSRCSSLSNIDDNAFRSTSISEVVIPGCVKVIGNACFANCESLRSVAFDEAEYLVIGNKAFQSTLISGVTLPSSLARIGNECLLNCTKLKRFEFAPDASIEIIDTVDILKGTKSCAIFIHERLRNFHASLLPDGCSVSIDENNTSFMVSGPFVLTTDGTKLVRCFKSKSVMKIPQQVKVIAKNAFRNCSKVQEVVFVSGACIEKIQRQAFFGCKLKKILIPASTRVFYSSFLDCRVAHLSFTSDNRISQSTPMRDRPNPQLVPIESRDEQLLFEKNWVFNQKKTKLVSFFAAAIKFVLVPKRVQVLCEHCFACQNHVKTIDFERGTKLQAIESFALSDTSITTITIPKLVKRVADNAFAGCPQLARIIFDEKCVLKTITKGMLNGTTLEHIYISANVEHIEPDAITGIKSVDIAPTNKHIDRKILPVCDTGYDTLGACIDKKRFVLRDDVLEIPTKKFYGAKWLQQLSYSGETTLKLIGAAAFAKSGLRDVHIPDSVQVLEPGCFECCKRLKTVSFGAELEMSILPERAFHKACLRSIIIPIHVTIIGKKCFACTPLNSVTFPLGCSLEIIDDMAFYATEVTTVVIPRIVVTLGNASFCNNESLTKISFEGGSMLKHIGTKCFEGCRMQRIEIPPLVDDIGNKAFSGIKQVGFDPENQHFSCTGTYIVSKDLQVVCGCFAPSDELVLPQCSAVMKCAFREYRIRSVVFPRTVTRLGESAFEKSTLESVIIPSAIRSIGRSCFAKCSMLVEVKFQVPSVLRTLSERVFAKSSISSIVIPSSVKTIGRGCFSGCKQLASLVFQKSSKLTQIQERAFKMCGIRQVSFPDSVKMIGALAFLGNRDLETVSFSAASQLQLIGKACFGECLVLPTVTLPGTIYKVFADSFHPECAITLNEADVLVSDAFDTWREQDGGEDFFVNPSREQETLIKGCLTGAGQNPIGAGGQAVVKLKRNEITGEVIVTKTMHFLSSTPEGIWEDLKARALAVQELHHPSLVAMKGVVFNDSRRRMTVGMEFVKGPLAGCDSSLNVKQVIDSDPDWWTLGMKIRVILGIAAGIQVIHGFGLLHRDLKPSNVLLDEHFRPKICDFDVARLDEDNESGMKTAFVGTFGYMAPEVATGEYGQTADYYSLGAVAYHVFEGTNAFRDSFVAGNPMNFSDKTPEPMRNVIQDCVAQDPDERCCFMSQDQELFDVILTAISHLSIDGHDQALIHEYVDFIREAVPEETE